MKRVNIQQIIDIPYVSPERAARRKGAGASQEFFTPYSIIKRMGDKISKSDWADPEKTFGEPCFGNGNILLYIIYYDYILHVKYDEMTKEKDLLLPKRILRNEKLPEASTFDTVLTLVDKVFRFMSVYDCKCYELFHFKNAQDWFYCYNVQKFDMEYKYKYKFNDHNIPSTMERFFNIDDKEIYRLLDLNFSP